MAIGERPEFDLSIHGSMSNPSPAAVVAMLAPPAPSIIPAELYTASRRIVAFTGLAGSGKSTAALHLVEQGWTRVRFAGPLKAMMAALGLTQDEIEGSRKEVPCDLLAGKTPRYAMQTIGTEWGRDIIAPDLWIRAWRAALPAAGSVVVDDCRFKNEAEAVTAAGGFLIRVSREGAGAGAAGHSSEALCASLPAITEIQNNGTVPEFLRAVEQTVCDLSHVAAALQTR